MASRTLLYGLVLPLVGGIAVILVAAAIDLAVLRLALQVAALCAAVAGAWFLSPHTPLHEKQPAHVLASLAADRRMPGLDRSSGLFAEWYFLLRAGDELERARRFEEPLALVSVSRPPPARPAAAIYASRLREEVPGAEIAVLAYPEDGQALIRALRADELHFR